MNTIQGIRSADGLDLFVDGKKLSLEKTLKSGVNHSPTGFNAGYAGSGPAQSAFAIMQKVIGTRKAKYCYQAFKFAFLTVPEYGEASKFEFTLDVKAWAEAYFEDRGFHFCTQCEKEIGVEYLLGEVCLSCTRKNHKKATGG